LRFSEVGSGAEKRKTRRVEFGLWKLEQRTGRRTNAMAPVATFEARDA